MSAQFQARQRRFVTEDFKIAATVSGSFHRHMQAISSAVQDLASRGIRVLSPADPRVVAAQGEFLFVASDRVRSVRVVQDRHLECIRAANFVWLVCPDGYVGQSAAMEVGFAAAAGVPLFSTRAPNDLTLREYVRVVPSLAEVLDRVTAVSRPRRQDGILIDPHASIEEVHDRLGHIEATLTCSTCDDEPARRVYGDVLDVQTMLRLPSLVQ